MSMSISVLISGPIPNPTEVQRVVNDLGFDLSLTDVNAPLDSASGFRTATYGADAKEAGVEIYVESARDFALDRGVEVEARFDRAIWFRWGSKMEECYSALALCSAIATVANGSIYADYQGSFVATEEVVAEAKSASNLLKR